MPPLTFTPSEIALVKPATDLALTLLKPLVEKALELANLTKERVKFELYFGTLNEYLQNSYKRHSYFNSLVFKNEQKLLDNYYLPLTLLKYPKNKPFLIKGFPHELISQYKRLMIVDTAGMGKSTISKHLFLTCIREKKAIPILIELRKLSIKMDIVDFIVENTKIVDDEVSRKLLTSLISAGRFMFLLDGYDEILETDRPTITSNISAFIAEAPNNWYVMTSRNEDSLSAFPDFQRFTIKPLNEIEAYNLLRLYGQGTQIAQVLIERLKENENENIHEFLASPLLTSLLFKSFEFRRMIPIRKHIFYRQVFEALFETHDLMKEDYQRVKRSGLDIDQFDELLRYFSFITYKDGKSEYTKNELLTYLEKAKQLTANKNLVSSNVIYDLTHGVPLMIEEGNYFRWVHKSMQEYFSALWVCRDSKEKQQDCLLKMYKNKKHQNLTILCADIDPIVFRKIVIKELATSLLDIHETSYLKVINRIPEKKILIRKQFVTGKNTFIVNGINENKSEFGRTILYNMIEYAESKGLSSEMLTWIWLDFAMIGIIPNDGYTMLDDEQFRKIIPFIRTAPPDLANHTNEKLYLPMEIIIPIDDNPNNPINQEKSFNRINKILEKLHQRTNGWYFDYNHAREVLIQIETEISESNSLEL